jgi:hypothetical protein
LRKLLLLVFGMLGFYPFAHSQSPAVVALGKGVFSYEVRDADTGELIPCKLTFVSNLYYVRISRKDLQTGDKATPSFHQIYSFSGIGKVNLLPGEYDVYISRGPEWELTQIKKQKISSGKASEAKVELRKAINTEGWVSGDFHVHAEPSPDSVISLTDRLHQLVSEGLMMVGSADHQDVTDYTAKINELGMQDTISCAPGEELSMGAWGHWGVFPLTRVEGVRGHGAVPSRGKTIDEIFDFVRTNHPDAVLTVHHPRLDNGISYFNLAGFQSKTAAANKKGFRLDFDAIELLNGYRLSQPASIQTLIKDWFGLLNHGYLVTALGNSDTHYLTGNVGGYPRNYIWVGEENVTSVTPKMIAQSVKQHHVFVTTGPFVRFSAEGADIGDLVVIPKGSTQLSITVEAPQWISVSKVTLFINGEVSQSWAVTNTGKTVRFQQSVPLTLTKDSYAVVQVEGDKTLSPVYGSATTYKVFPFAITNPIFFDVNSNGVFDAPLAKSTSKSEK